MDSASRLKVHRHAVSLDGRAATVLRLRPAQSQRFATNHFHETWHVLSDPAGARLLGRLCWALSYQRRPDTLVVIDRPELVANPFDGDASDTVVVSNAELGPFTTEMAKGLRAWLRRRHDSDGTVVLQTPGLTVARAEPHAFWQAGEQAYWKSPEYRKRTWIDCVNRCVVLAAPPAVLRAWGVSLSELGETFYNGSDYTYLDWPARNGEIQVFPDFLGRVAAAAAGRVS